ncbi:MAG: HU family DNA-binding protein [Thermodesulfobacteriales bacterium]|jgi:DNA-binding protein HU-beta|nr:MAG: HU family DNA-binding protein [Thermodesulfobacteriales bacterium]
MTKSELIGQIAENAGISKSEADKAYDAVISAIVSGLKKDGNVPLTGLGTLKVAHRAARSGRNPSTGETIQIAAKNVLKFKASKSVEEEIA